MSSTEESLRQRCEVHGQGHVFRFWDQLDEAQRSQLCADIEQVDFPLIERLVDTWLRHEPEAERFDQLEPVPCIPPIDAQRPDAREALEAGEEALRQGRVGLFLVAGGQGTRLGFDGPKGAYPVGPLTGKTLFAYHAEKIQNLQRRYGCTLPWYIMVSEANEAATRAFFQEHSYFGLRADDIWFVKQRMVPCVDADGKFFLDEPGRLAMNPNGHGGSIPCMVESGVLKDARQRGVEVLSYFQVDNWAVKVVDPYFVGYHMVRGAAMASKVHRKQEPRESVGVHCLCDGEYRIIEYSELDIYPQLLETNPDGSCVYFAGNPAIHTISVDFVQQVFDRFDTFPWHLAHKKIPHIDARGERVKPDAPNGYKFETFVFDALRFTDHPPVALEILAPGEYTPIKQFDGANSVVAARQSMADFWGGWLEHAGATVGREDSGGVATPIEISPAFALTESEFLEEARGLQFPAETGITVDAAGKVEAHSVTG